MAEMTPKDRATEAYDRAFQLLVDSDVGKAAHPQTRASIMLWVELRTHCIEQTTAAIAAAVDECLANTITPEDYEALTNDERKPGCWTAPEEETP